jgi:hypothetical protein
MSNTTTEDQIDTIWDALIFLELRRDGKMRGEQWTTSEMRALKKACYSKNAPAIGPDLYRGMVAERNDWSIKAGALDINQVESYQQQYENHLSECQ